MAVTYGMKGGWFKCHGGHRIKIKDGKRRFTQWVIICYECGDRMTRVSDAEIENDRNSCLVGVPGSIPGQTGLPLDSVASKEPNRNGQA